VGGWVWLSFVVLGLNLQCRCNHSLHNFVRLYKLSIIVFCDMFIKNETILILNNSSKTHLSSSQFMGVLNMAFRMYQVGQIILYILHVGLGLLTGKRASCFVIWRSYVMQCVCSYHSVRLQNETAKLCYSNNLDPGLYCKD
jgi:hypothetical protein